MTKRCGVGTTHSGHDDPTASRSGDIDPELVGLDHDTTTLDPSIDIRGGAALSCSCRNQCVHERITLPMHVPAYLDESGTKGTYAKFTFNWMSFCAYDCLGYESGPSIIMHCMIHMRN